MTLNSKFKVVRHTWTPNVKNAKNITTQAILKTQFVK